MEMHGRKLEVLVTVLATDISRERSGDHLGEKGKYSRSLKNITPPRAVKFPERESRKVVARAARRME